MRAALDDMDLDTWVYKPPDDARNWKPADFILWWDDPDSGELLSVAQTAMIEVKDTAALRVYNLSDIRPSQHNAMMRAQIMGIPYLVAIWWRRHKRWTISIGSRLFREEKRSLRYLDLSSSLGLDCTQDMLASTLRSILVDGIIWSTADEPRS